MMSQIPDAFHVGQEDRQMHYPALSDVFVMLSGYSHTSQTPRLTILAFITG